MPRRLRVSRLQALTMEAGSGSFFVAGFNADLIKARHLEMQLTRGIFQWSGFNAELSKHQYTMVASAGTFTVTGRDATFTYSAEGWDTTIPTQTGNTGVPFTLNLDDFWNGSSLPTYSLSSGSLPAGLSLGGARNSVLSGTPTTAQTVSPILLAATSSLEADWTSRAAYAVAAGGRAIRFNTSAEAIGTPSTGNTNLATADGSSATTVFQQAHMVWDTTIKRSGAGSLRFNILATDGADSGAFRWHVRPDFANIGNGGEYYVQWSQYMPSEFAFGVFPGNQTFAPFAGGFKQIILSHYGARIGASSWGAESGGESGGSNNGEAIVVDNVQQMGFPQIYYYNGISGATDNSATVPVFTHPNCSSAARQYQNAIDNTSVSATNCNTVRQRYGPIYPLETANSGTPNFNNGGVVYVPGWMTWMLRVKIGSFGSPNTICEMWGCVSGQAPRKLITTAAMNIGFGVAGHGGFWLTPYNTGRTPTTFDTYTCITEVLTSVGASPIPFPGGFNVTPR